MYITLLLLEFHFNSNKDLIVDYYLKHNNKVSIYVCHPVYLCKNDCIKKNYLVSVNVVAHFLCFWRLKQKKK